MPGLTLLRKRPFSALEPADSQISQTANAYLRKTRQGRVIKVFNENYLRDDLPCGSQACDKCAQLYDRLNNEDVRLENEDGDEKRWKSAVRPLLGPRGRDRLASDVKRHYVVIDTNIALHQMDILESTLFGNDVIVPSTVLQETKHRSLPLFNRLRALIADESRRFWLFQNEARNDTYCVPQPGETSNDRNDRAIRTTAQWYTQHLNIDIVLLSDDAGNRKLATKQAIKAKGVKEYLSLLPEDSKNALLDLVAALGEDGLALEKEKAKTTFTDEYLSSAELTAGLKAGTLHQGYFNPNPYNYKEATVSNAAFTKPILLVGHQNMNRCISGDLVIVKVLPESEWVAPTDELVDNDEDVRNEGDSEHEDENDEEAAQERKLQRDAKDKAKMRPSEKQPTGKVVGFIKRAWRSYVCHLDRSTLSPAALASNAPQNVFALPLDRKIPRIRIRTRQASSLANQKFLVAIDSWPTTSKSPEGHFVRALGQTESKEAEIESLLLEFDVPYRPFSNEVLKCLPDEGDGWKVPPKEKWVKREDLRDLLICSIDPPGCQDIDDALHARRLPNGNIEAGVHIADVSHFVHSDNPMDSEAASRGTTVYLVDKRIDMLPPLLGTNLCSLRPYVERFAFSTFWELDSEANIVNVRFTKSVIASKAAFTYSEAQLRKDDPSLKDDLTNSIRLLNHLAIKLRGKRMAAGALNLASPEVKIHLDSSESTGPIDVEQKAMLETNSLVEEFMLLANISVARKIHETFPQTAVLRRHLPPPQTNFDILADVLQKRKGRTLDCSSSGALAKSLDLCVDPKDPTFNTLVRIMATRCMLSAEYFGSGSVARDTFGHYGLASDIYTHFTSPIRRYADVLVHRQLSAAISGKALHPTLHSKAFVERVMENINKRHRSAQQAGRASVEFYTALALKGKEEEAVKSGKGKIVEDAFVIRAFKNGLAVFVSKFGLEGLITFKRENSYDPETYEITVPSPNGSEVKIGVFDKVRVEITVEKDKNTQRGKVKMHLVDPVDSRSL